MNNPWQTIRSRILHQSRWLTLYEDDVITPEGIPSKYTYAESPPFVLTVAYTGERFVLVRQYRYPLHRIINEIPGGSIDEGEEPLAAAKRELQEETGFTAKTWTRLGTILNPNPATIFLAEELTDTGKNSMSQDGIEKCLLLTQTELDTLIDNGELVDSKTLAALFLFKRYRSRT